MGRSWSLLTLDETERQFGGNLGYEDVLGSRYHWDSTVANGRAIQPGDLAVLRDSRSVFGVAWIDDVSTEASSKMRRRCPRCNNTGFKSRTSKVPQFKCSDCRSEFDTPVEETIPVTVYVADYQRTWRPISGLPSTALDAAYLARAKQHAIRELNTAALPKLLSDPADLGPHWWLDAGVPHIAGGHRLTIGRQRIGQPRFRDELRRRLGDLCAISGPQPPAALEAAHLYRYCETGHHDVHGGLLLRRDLHTLFDRFLLAIDPATWKVRVAPSLRTFPDLAALDGRPLSLHSQHRPHAYYLEAHLAWAEDLWERQLTEPPAP